MEWFVGDATCVHIVGLYHKSLLQCLLHFLAHAPSLLPVVMSDVFLSWPDARAGNTPKEILLLHEMERLVISADPGRHCNESLSYCLLPHATNGVCFRAVSLKAPETYSAAPGFWELQREPSVR